MVQYIYITMVSAGARDERVVGADEPVPLSTFSCLHSFGSANSYPPKPPLKPLRRSLEPVHSQFRDKHQSIDGTLALNYFYGRHFTILRVDYVFGVRRSAKYPRRYSHIAYSLATHQVTTVTRVLMLLLLLLLLLLLVVVVVVLRSLVSQL